MPFEIRLAREEDIPRIDQLYARSYPKLLKPDYAPSILVTVVPAFSKSQPSLVVSGKFFVAETDGGAILGAGGWSPRGPRGEQVAGTGHVRHFATDPNATRQGVGKGLMSACLDQAKRAGIKHMNCYSTLTAVKFYEAMGFTQIGPIDLEFGQTMHFPAIAMKRDLP